FSPSTNIIGVGIADVSYGLAIEGDIVTRKELTIEATVTTLCTCSIEISEYSAHNKRGVVTFKRYIYKDLNIVDVYKNNILDAIEANA
ncbi:GTP cyclohydrolase, FolE2/MptA family, partial [Staphylococcus aureus]|uniref:GTP cyclohydrolase, FolE2/MptA family n=1 Tax=Staphylococcus aureus TaxID=1280 RepID=UPI003F97FD91